MIEPNLVWMYSQVVIWNHSFSRVHQTLTRLYLPLMKLSGLLYSFFLFSSVSLSFLFLLPLTLKPQSYVTHTTHVCFLLPLALSPFSVSHTVIDVPLSQRTHCFPRVLLFLSAFLRFTTLSQRWYYIYIYIDLTHMYMYVCILPFVRHSFRRVSFRHRRVLTLTWLKRSLH